MADVYNQLHELGEGTDDGGIAGTTEFATQDDNDGIDFENSTIIKSDNMVEDSGQESFLGSQYELGDDDVSQANQNFTLIANGQYLMDEGGNVVGQLSEDGMTYTLFSPVEEQFLDNDKSAPLDQEHNISDGLQLENGDSEEKEPCQTSEELPPGDYNMEDMSTEDQENQENVKVEVKTDENQINMNTEPNNYSEFPEVAQEDNSEETFVNNITKETVQLKLESMVNSPQQTKKIVPVTEDLMRSSQPSVSIITPGIVQQSTTPNQTKLAAPKPRLGSKTNPIRIVQHGNQYSSMQQLSNEQMKSILKFIQQQRLTTSQNVQTVVYCQPENSPIVYQPLSGLSAPINPLLSSVPPVSATPTYSGKKRGRKRKSEIMEKNEEVQKKIALSKIEENKRKKLKTRSGRVSKPPKHMVEEYKHIPLKEWDEDYDDSDGGYSDYKEGSSDEHLEEHPKQNREVSPPRHPEENVIRNAYEMLQPKKFRCGTCTKSYIGKNGLERHLKNNPLHSVQHSTNRDMEVDESRDSDIHETNAEGEEGEATSSSFKHARRRKLAYNSKHKKLIALLSRCNEETVLDSVVPPLSEITSLYEYIVVKSLFNSPERQIRFQQIFQEITELQSLLQDAVEKCILLPTEDSSQAEEPEVDVPEEVANFLGLKPGKYGFDSFTPTTPLLTRFMVDQGLIQKPKEDSTTLLDDTTTEGSAFKEHKPETDLDDDSNSLSTNQETRWANPDKQPNTSSNERAFQCISQERRLHSEDEEMSASAGSENTDQPSVSSIMSPVEHQSITESQHSEDVLRSSGDVSVPPDTEHSANKIDEQSKESVSEGEHASNAEHLTHNNENNQSVKEEEENSEVLNTLTNTRSQGVVSPPTASKSFPGLSQDATGSLNVVASATQTESGIKKEVEPSLISSATVSGRPVLTDVESPVKVQAATSTTHLMTPPRTVAVKVIRQSVIPLMQHQVPPISPRSPAQVPPISPRSPAQLLSISPRSPAQVPPISPRSPAQVPPISPRSPALGVPVNRSIIKTPPPRLMMRTPGVVSVPTRHENNLTNLAVTRNPNGSLSIQILGDTNLPMEAIQSILSKFPLSSLQVGVQKVITLSQN